MGPSRTPQGGWPRWMAGQTMFSLFHWGSVSPTKALDTHRLLFPLDRCPLILPPPAQLNQHVQMQRFWPQQVSGSLVLSSYPRGIFNTVGNDQTFYTVNSKKKKKAFGILFQSRKIGFFEHLLSLDDLDKEKAIFLLQF